MKTLHSAVRTKSKRGSILLVTVVLCTIILAVLVPAALGISRANARESTLAMRRSVALDLAESGLEHGTWALRTLYAGGDGWAGWTASGTTATRTFGSLGIPGVPSTGARIEVTVSNIGAQTVQITSRGVVSGSGSPSVSRTLTADVSSGPAPFRPFTGVTLRGTLNASGGATFDSWNPFVLNDPSYYQPYQTSLSRNNILVATISTAEPAINIGSADIYGRAAVGSANKTGLGMGWGGAVGPRSESEWDPLDLADLWKVNGWKAAVRTGYLTTSYTADIPLKSPPSNLNPVNRGSYTLSYTAQVQKSNQWSSWTENAYVNTDTIGTSGQSSVVQMDSLKVKADGTLTVAGNVTILLPSTSGTTLTIEEGGKLVLANGANLTIWTQGGITVSGAGLVNSGAPKNLQIFGYNPSSQNITFQGSGSISGVIYAPNATITMPGATTIYGALIGKEMTLSGSGSVHYDESLGEHAPFSGGSSAVPPKVTAIREINSPARS